MKFNLICLSVGAIHELPNTGAIHESPRQQKNISNRNYKQQK